MSRLSTFLRSLGSRGALANAEAVIEARAQEDWLIEGLTHRLEPIAGTTSPCHRIRVA